MGRYGDEDLRAFAMAASEAAGVHRVAARDLAEVLVEAELRGVSTHGLRRLPGYLARVRSGAVDGDASPVVEERDGAVTVDARNAVGPHAGVVAADAVVARAQEVGTAAVTVRGSNHFAFAGYYATRIAAHGMVAVVVSNGTPSIAPPGGLRPFVCNDPIAVAAPYGAERFVELDMATSVTSRDNLRRAAEEGRPIPLGWAHDVEGRPTTDAAAAMDGTMLPLGGDRGFALIFALEMLTGLLPDAAVADEVSSKDREPDVPEGLGHFMLALRIPSFVDPRTFAQRLGGMIERMRATPRAEGADPPRHPGERRWSTRARRLQAGVPLHASTVTALEELAAGVGVEFPVARDAGGG